MGVLKKREPSGLGVRVRLFEAKVHPGFAQGLGAIRKIKQINSSRCIRTFFPSKVNEPVWPPSLRNTPEFENQQSLYERCPPNGPADRTLRKRHLHVSESVIGRQSASRLLRECKETWQTNYLNILLLFYRR